VSILEYQAYTDKKENQIDIRKCGIISPYIRRPLGIDDFATAPF
jgi:hypothetical protein